MPKVSVLFPVYNTKEEYLRVALESILNQTYRDFEFLIINDASSDENTEKVIKSYTDERIRYIVNEQNIGISGTRNKLINLARGEYLAVMDHDDISMPERLEKQVAFLDENPDVGVLGGQYEKLPGGKLGKKPLYDKEIKLALMRDCAILHSASMLRKSALVNNSICYEKEFSPAEDYALWCRLSPYTRFHNLPDVLLQYRDHEENTSKIQSKKMEEATLAIYAFLQVENPVLYNLFLLKATRTIRYRFLGLTFIKVVTKKAETKVMLFGRIPLLTVKQSVKLKES